MKSLKITLWLFGFCFVSLSARAANTLKIDLAGKTIFYLELATDVHEQDKKIILHWLNEYLGKDLVVVETETFTQAIERYFLGFKGSSKMILNYYDYDYKYQTYLAKKLCEKMKCDFIYKGEELSGYSYPEFWNHQARFIPDAPLHVVRNSEDLSFSTKLSADSRKVLYQKLDYRLAYWGKNGSVIYYQTDEETEKNYPEKVGSFFTKNMVDYRLKDVVLDQKRIKQLVENSNADCAYTQMQDALSFCHAQETRSYFPAKHPLPVKSRLSLKNGTGELEIFETSAQQSLTKPILHDSLADTVYDPEFVTIYYRPIPETFEQMEKTISKYSWLNQYDNMLIEYKNKNQVVAKIKLKDLHKKDMERLHELLVESLNPDYFTIYEWRYDNQLALVGEFQPDIIPALNQSSVRKMRDRAAYSIGTKIENRFLDISADNNISFIERDNSDAVSFYSLYSEWWAKNSRFGAKAHMNVFTYQYSVINGLGQTDANGSSGEYSLMAGYRKKLEHKYLDEIRYYVGPSKKHILISGNNSIGDLKYLNLNFQVEGLKQFGKYILSSELQVSRIMSAKTEMDGFSTSDGSGLWFHLSGKASYPIYKNMFLSTGALYRNGKVEFSEGSARMQEFGIFLGLDFLSVGY